MLNLLPMSHTTENRTKHKLSKQHT